MASSTVDGGSVFWSKSSATKIEAATKMHLTPNGGVAPKIEMLTYWRVRSAFNFRAALPLSVIYYFCDSFVI